MAGSSMAAGVIGVAAWSTRHNCRVRWTVAGDSVASLLLASDGSRLYCRLANGDLACVAAETGTQRWRLESPVEHSVGPVLTDSGGLLVGAGRAIVKVSGTSGQPMWRRVCGTTRVTVLLSSGNRVYALGERATAVDATNGDIIWSRVLGTGRRGLQRPHICQDAVLAQGLLVAVSAGGRTTAACLDAATGDGIWECDVYPTEGSDQARATVLADGRGAALVADGYGVLCAIRLRDGRQLWRELVAASTRVTMRACGEIAVCVSDGGDVVGIDLPTGHEVWRMRPAKWAEHTKGEPCASSLLLGLSPPGLARVAAQDGRLLARGAVPGNPLTRWLGPTDGVVDAVVSRTVAYTATAGGQVSCVEPPQ